jgi:DNA polymerase-1
VTPDLVPAYLALLGDTSDNIRGIDGIGPKTASKLLTDFGGLDGLREHLADVKPDRIRKSLEESADLLERNMKLIILDSKEIAGWNGLEGIRRKLPDWEKIRAMAVEQNFKSLMTAIDKAMKASRQPTLF